MILKNPIYVVCTPYHSNEFVARSETFRFFNDNNLIENSDYFVFTENTVSLGKRYNQFLTEKYKDNIVVFLHDDIVLGYHHITLRRMLNEGHLRYDILGLAGATRMNLTYPTLWHLMAKGMSGSVGHQVDGHSQMSNYGASPQKCIAIDGLFISVNVDRMLNAKHRFDEQFNFHHYDLDFCIQANEKKLSVGTWPIWVTHLSPGLTSLEKSDWKGSNELFCKKYNIA